MPAIHARNVALTRQLARFVDELIATAAYNDASEMVRDGLCELQRRKYADQLTEIRARIGVGLDQLDQGVKVGAAIPRTFSEAFSTRQNKRGTAIDEDRCIRASCTCPARRHIRLHH